MAPFPAASTWSAGLSGSPQHNGLEAFVLGVAAWVAKHHASPQEGGSLSCCEGCFSRCLFTCGLLCTNSQAQHSWHLYSRCKCCPPSITQCFIGWRTEILLGCATGPMQLMNYWGSLCLATGLPAYLPLRNPAYTANCSGDSLALTSLHCSGWHLSCQLFASLLPSGVCQVLVCLQGISQQAYDAGRTWGGGPWGLFLRTLQDADSVSSIPVAGYLRY